MPEQIPPRSNEADPSSGIDWEAYELPSTRRAREQRQAREARETTRDPRRRVGWLAYLAIALTTAAVVIGSPLRDLVTGHDESREFAFIETVGDQPMTFSSCQMIPVVVNVGQEPDGASGLVGAAVGEASRASGLRIAIVGTTNVIPDIAADSYPYDVLTSDPVIIAWTNPRQVPALSGSVLGVGGPLIFNDHYVSGHVALDAPQISDMITAGRSDEAKAVIMHELGHVLGLAHVKSKRELMYEAQRGQTSYGPGDLAGLQRVGDGPCL